jgi:superoxide dismutase, Cu-Zn family
MLKIITSVLTTLLLTTATVALADISVPMNFTAEQGVGKSVGSVLISETKYGLLFTPELNGLATGIHGFHIHLNPSCDQDGMAAGGHFDPKNTGKHLGPYNDNGHLGDLPAVTIVADGTGTLPVLAPRLMRIADIRNHSLMLHEGGDNYSDTPAKLGGGGMRMACGIIK